MSGPAGFLEFFILEASDYVEQLDGIVLRGGATGPDADGMQRIARALRGTATMAKLPSFAELASSLERVGRSLYEGALVWDPSVGGALVAAIDDLKVLLHAVRNWSSADDQRAVARAAELARYAPSRVATSRPSAQPSGAAGLSSFLATEASNIAAGLELLTTRPDDTETAANVVRRVRALRGVAGVKDIGPLAEVLEATENAARGLETGEERLSPEGRQLLEAAAAHLRALSSALRGDGDVNAPSSSREAFHAALDAWVGSAGERERVVPIADLFYDDGVPGLVQAAQNPPTSMAERFHLELVSLGEHLRQVIDSAREATDAGSAARARRDLRTALRALQAAAQSFGQSDIATFVGEYLDVADHVDFLGLAALDDLASVLAEPGIDGKRITARLNELSEGRDLTSAIGAGFGSSDPAAQPAAPHRSSMPSPLRIQTPAFPQAAPPVVAPTAPSPRAATPAAPTMAPLAPLAPLAPVAPTPRANLAEPEPETETVSSESAGSAALLDFSIAALASLDAAPFAEPIPIPEDIVVPIESLLYRGRAALDRAAEIRDELRRAGLATERGLDELFDLIELARTE